MQANPFEQPRELFEDQLETRETLIERLSTLRQKHNELTRTLATADEHYAGKTLSERETQARQRAQSLLLTELQIVTEEIDSLENKLTELPPLQSSADLAHNENDPWGDPGHRGGNNRAANA